MNKGQPGYLAQYKKRRIIIAGILILGIIAFVLTGYLTTKTIKNLLTVMGILLSLPLAKMLATLIVVLPMKTMDVAKCHNIMKGLPNIGSDQFLWDLALASTDIVRHFPIVACSDRKVIAYFSGKEDKSEQEKARTFFSHLLKNNCHRVDLQMFYTEESFLKAAKAADFSVINEEEWERVMETILVYEM